jgi:hypothetical protein
VQGLETGKVNLNYTGEMKSDFERTPQQISVNEYEVSFSNPIDNDKARGNENHFRKVIFEVSKKEIEVLLDTTEKQLKLILS